MQGVPEECPFHVCAREAASMMTLGSAVCHCDESAAPLAAH
jgi:hypothetical protein